jgi:hypothetical protein
MPNTRTKRSEQSGQASDFASRRGTQPFRMSLHCRALSADMLGVVSNMTPAEWGVVITFSRCNRG